MQEIADQAVHQIMAALVAGKIRQQQGGNNGDLSGDGLKFHVGPTLVLRRLSPGVFSSTFLYLPIGVWIYFQALRDGVLTLQVAVSSVILGASVMCLPVALFVAICQ